MPRFLPALALLLALTPAAHAGESATLTRSALEGHGSATGAASFIETGAQALAARAATNATDNEARFGLGLLRFARAVERYGQAQYRYGLQPPKNLAVPFLRFPVPLNASPEELTYDKQRVVLQNFLDDLKAAEAALANVTASDVKIVLDLNEAHFDLTGSGKANPANRLGAILTGMHITDAAKDKKPEAFEVAFDNADALWLQGYCNLLSAMLEFTLAHDWHVGFEHAAHLFYPRVSPALLASAPSNSLARGFGMPGENSQFADALALLHDLNWPVADAARMPRAHAHLKKVVSLSRATWKAVLAETDDDREWLAGPQQKNGVIKIFPMSKEQVDGWHDVLDDFDAVLDGKKLIPHWRFSGGINLKKVFYEPRAFDAVLWATGHAAIPFIETGPAISQNVWNQWQRVFGGNFIGYAFWIN